MSTQSTISIRKKSYLEYLFEHCIPRGIHNFRRAIVVWLKLLRGDYSEYLVYERLSDSEYFDMLRMEFWNLLEDDTLDKETYDYLLQAVYEVETGQVELIPWVFDEDDEKLLK